MGYVGVAQRGIMSSILGKCYWRTDKKPLDKFIEEILALFAETGQTAQTIFCHPSLVNEINVGIRVMPASININGFILSGSVYDSNT